MLQRDMPHLFAPRPLCQSSSPWSVSLTSICQRVVVARNIWTTELRVHQQYTNIARHAFWSTTVKLISDEKSRLFCLEHCIMFTRDNSQGCRDRQDSTIDLGYFEVFLTIETLMILSTAGRMVGAVWLHL